MGLSNEAGEVRTLELLVQSPATRDAEGTDELFKVNSAIFVLVKDVEDVVCKISWISEGEELLIYTTEFDLVQITGRTILEEAFVPRGWMKITSMPGDYGNKMNHCCSSLLSTKEEDD